jgi:hypothetical protein
MDGKPLSEITARYPLTLLRALATMCLGGKHTMKRSDFVESGREGGKIAASRMTQKQRSERARKAALAKAKQAKAGKGKA